MTHFLVTSFPLHGHINHPTFEFAWRLARAGARVTFLSSVAAYWRIIESPPLDASSCASFSNGYDDGFNFPINNDSTKITSKRADNTPRSRCAIPSVALWIQPAAVLAVYYHYFHGYDHLINKVKIDPDFLVELPKVPPMASIDLPSMLLPSDPHFGYPHSIPGPPPLIDKELKEGRPKPRLLVNKFDSSERVANGSVDELDLICIGPLISSTPKKTSSGSDCMEWLESRLASSVVYVCFGSVISPCKRQMEEILNRLLEARRPFLWVIKGSDTGSETGEIKNRVDGCGEGLVVPWCSQVEALARPSAGCFVTHCGWNSTSGEFG
ncbi:hypothetical protein AAC387_Pa08g2573 [Persea americana]